LLQKIFLSDNKEKIIPKGKKIIEKFKGKNFQRNITMKENLQENILSDGLKRN